MCVWLFCETRVNYQFEFVNFAMKPRDHKPGHEENKSELVLQ